MRPQTLPSKEKKKKTIRKKDSMKEQLIFPDVFMMYICDTILHTSVISLNVNVFIRPAVWEKWTLLYKTAHMK